MAIEFSQNEETSGGGKSAQRQRAGSPIFRRGSIEVA